MLPGAIALPRLLCVRPRRAKHLWCRHPVLYHSLVRRLALLPNRPFLLPSGASDVRKGGDAPAGA